MSLSYRNRKKEIKKRKRAKWLLEHMEAELRRSKRKAK